MQEQLPPSQRMQRLYLRTYRLRTLGMGLGILPAALVLLGIPEIAPQP